MGSLLIAFGLVLLITSVALLLLVRNERQHQQQRRETAYYQALRLPEGTLVYKDADGQGTTLSSSAYPLIGKPDYVIQQRDGRLVPLELKLSTKGATQPYSNHVIQVAAYCLILEDYADEAPTHGILRYADRDFTVEYTPALRKKVLRQLRAMSTCDEKEQPVLKTQNARKCQACPFRAICPIGQAK
uniref:CRISPR-associated exonuclease Cas4 n=1 Tax=Thermosporothrix sp. COM3 TaxID=2490863 RepID=A0A455SPU2_9CHLR|nr:CRISPR-associated protein Cas4 [Thermosporothrix sp. COM3]